MGSRGSLHFKNEETEKIVKALVEAYADETTDLNSDVTHNGWGKPFIVITEKFISVYDGSFANSGDMNTEGKLLSQRTKQPVLAFNNINDDMMCLSVYAGDEEVTGATFADGEWWDSIDVDILLETMQMGYSQEDWAAVFAEDMEEPSEMLEAFESLTGQTYAVDLEGVTGYWPGAQMIQETNEIVVFSVQ